jgi:putative Ca2+/H+ antiporter (TMEM165/GDT1 family)
MWIDILTAFFFIFLAELGDKSQVLAMTLATKYRTKTVIIGVFFGVLLNHIIAIFFGSILQDVLTPTWISIVVGCIFLIFGMLSLLERPHENTLQSYRFPAVIAVAGIFFLAELGDKTQFATMALSLELSQPWLLLLGTVPAMLTTSIIAIWIGRQLGERVPEFAMKIISTLLFISYGSVRLGQYFYPLSSAITIVGILIVILVYLFLLYKYQQSNAKSMSAYKRVAKRLQQYYHTLSEQFETICLSERVCGVCETHGCILGHIKFLIEEGKQGRPVSMSHLRSKTMKQLDQKKLDQALQLTLSELQDNWQDEGYQTLHQIRQNIEFILYHKTLRSPTYEEYQRDLSLIKKKTQSQESI